MPLGALSITYSGLIAFQRKTSVTANNVANVNTDGFKKSRTVLSTAQPNGVTAEVEQVQTAGPIPAGQTANGQQSIEPSNVDIGEEMVNLLSGQRAYEANLRTLKTADAMVGSLLDIVADEER